MEQFRVKRPHGNGYGSSWAKRKGDTYELTEDQAKPLLRQGLIEKAGATSTSGKAKRTSKAVKAAPAKATAGDDSQG